MITSLLNNMFYLVTLLVSLLDYNVEWTHGIETKSKSSIISMLNCIGVCLHWKIKIGIFNGTNMAKGGHPQIWKFPDLFLLWWAPTSIDQYSDKWGKHVELDWRDKSSIGSSFYRFYLCLIRWVAVKYTSTSFNHKTEIFALKVKSDCQAEKSGSASSPGSGPRVLTISSVKHLITTY